MWFPLLLHGQKGRLDAKFKSKTGDLAAAITSVLRLSAAVCGRVAAFRALGQIFGLLLGSGGCKLEIAPNSPVKNLELVLP